MYLPNFDLKSAGQKQTRDKTSAFAFDRAVNGAITFKNINKRIRGGKLQYTEMIEKVGGTSELAEASGKGGPVKGGAQWVDQDFENTNRSRFVWVAEDTAYLYSIENETNVLLRDFSAEDGASVKFLSGWQQKNTLEMVIGDSTITDVFTYSGSVYGNITAVADNGSGKAQYTSAAHTMVNGNTMTVAGCTDTAYNVTGVISNVTTNTFDIETVTYTATDTGTWIGDTLTKRTTTNVNAGRLIGALGDRAMISGAGDETDITEYSLVSGTGVFTDFTDSTDVDGGGVLSGSLGGIKALYFHKGFGYTAESNRLVPHKITNYDVDGTGRVKNRITIVESAIIDGTGVKSPKAITDSDDEMYLFNQQGFYGFNIRTGLQDLSKNIRPLFKDFIVSNSSLAVDERSNRLIATCKSKSGVGDDTHILYSLDDPSVQFVNGKYTNQLIYDEVNKKMIGFSSISPKIVEVYSENTFVDGDNPIEVSAETRMYNMGDMYMNKIFTGFSCKVGAMHPQQTFTVNIRIDDNDTPSTTFTKSMEDVVTETGSGFSGWGSDDGWGSGTPNPNILSYGTILWRGFVPHFEKISIEIVEKSPYYCVIHQPVIRYKQTNDKINSFANTQTND